MIQFVVCCRIITVTTECQPRGWKAGVDSLAPGVTLRHPRQITQGRPGGMAVVVLVLVAVCPGAIYDRLVYNFLFLYTIY